MGIKIEPPEYGNDCLHCWGVGETPEFIYVTFSGVKKGDVPGSEQPPNGDYFKCMQQAGDPCEFVFNPSGFGWMVRLWRAPADGKWFVTLAYDRVQHFNAWNAGCQSEHAWWSNLLWSPIWWAGWGGWAWIFWLDAARSIVSAMNYPLDGNTNVEFFVKDGTEPVYKFCNLKYGLNQKFLISP